MEGVEVGSLHTYVYICIHMSLPADPKECSLRKTILYTSLTSVFVSSALVMKCYISTIMLNLSDVSGSTARLLITPPADWNVPPIHSLRLSLDIRTMPPCFHFHILLFTLIFINHITPWVDSFCSLTPLGHYSTQLPCTLITLTPLSFLISNWIMLQIDGDFNKK